MHSNIYWYCSHCWTISGRAVLMVTTVSQGEETWERKDDLVISCRILKVAISVPVLPTPALQWTRIGRSSALRRSVERSQGTEFLLDQAEE